MARPQREAASPSTLGPALLRYVSSNKKDHASVAMLAARGGLEPSDADKDEATMTTNELREMLEVTSELLGDPHIALRLPSELTFRRFDAGGLAARVAATPRDVLDAIARYAVLVFPHLEAKVLEEGKEIAFHTSIHGSPRGLGHHVDEYILAFALLHCRRGIEEGDAKSSLKPRRAWLTSARPAGDIHVLVRALGIEEIEFGAECTGFSLAIADATRSLPSFDPMLVAAAEHLASSALASTPTNKHSLATTVAAKIEASLADASAESIASAMKMSARTLQRRLEDEGIRFSTLHDECRERVAKNLLRGDADVPLTEIAYRVGFSDLATFSRAFKRWTGMPPGAFRRRDAT